MYGRPHDYLGKLVHLSEQMCAGFRLRSWPTALRVSLATLLLSLFLYALTLWSTLCDERCHDAITIANSPLSYGALHYPLAAYRITVPYAAYLLHLTGYWLLVIPIIANIANIALVFRMLAMRLGSVSGLLCTVTLALTQVGQVGNTWIGWPDPVSYLMLTIVMCLNRLSLLPLIIVLGAMADERFLIGLPGAILWNVSEHKWSLTHIRRIVLASVVALIAVFALRHLITIGALGPRVPQNVYDIFLSYRINWWHRPLAAFFAFRWFWLIPAGVIACGRIVSREYLPLAMLFVSCVVLTLPGDMTRSMAVAFPLFLLCYAQLHERSARVAERIMALALALNIVTPMLNIFLLSIWPSYPLPLVLWRTFHGRVAGYHWGF